MLDNRPYVDQSAKIGRFMDALVEDGFIVLGGPLDGEGEILHAISAPSEQAVRERLAQDNWAENGMLAPRPRRPSGPAVKTSNRRLPPRGAERRWWHSGSG
jgi:hypothetical protein